jgi:hypothetical protein
MNKRKQKRGSGSINETKKGAINFVPVTSQKLKENTDTHREL